MLSSHPLTSQLDPSEVTWDLVKRFVEKNDVLVSAEIYSQCYATLQNCDSSLVETAAPQLLRRCVNNVDSSSTSLLHFVAILNRLLCVSRIPPLMVNPVDRRPRGLDQLLSFYQEIIFTHGARFPLSVLRPLMLCVACLSLLTSDDLKSTIEAMVGELRQFSSREAVVYFCLFWISLADILADPRVCLGPIKRATHRITLQRCSHWVFEGPFCGKTLDLEGETVFRCTTFMLECLSGEPQDVNPSFWETLPTHRVWYRALEQIEQQGSETDVEFVCEVLRSLSKINQSAEQLIGTAVTTAAKLPDRLVACRIFGSVLESCAESIVLERTPDHPLYQMLSACGSYLCDSLADPDLVAEIGSLVCEAVSALTQALTVSPIPLKTEEDDEEDYEAFVADLHEENSKKSVALTHLAPFLQKCGCLLSAHVSRLTDFSAIVEYVRHTPWTVDSFEVAHDDITVALFTTYERVSILFSSIPSAPLTSPVLLLVLPSPKMTLHALLEWPSIALQQQASLLSVAVLRFAATSTNIQHTHPLWNVEETLSVVARLFKLWKETLEEGLAEAMCGVVEAVTLVCCDVAFKWQGKELAAAVADLWLPTLRKAPLDSRALYEVCVNCAKLIEAEVLHLQITSVNLILALTDPASQLELLTVLNPLNYDTLYHIFCLLKESLCGDVVTRAVRRISHAILHLLSSSQWSVGEFLDFLRAWGASSVSTTTPTLFLLLSQMESIFPESNPVLLSFLFQYFSEPNSHLCSNEDLKALLNPSTARALTLCPVEETRKVGELLVWLLHDSSVFLTSAGPPRLLILSEFLAQWSEGDRQRGCTLPFLERTLELFSLTAALFPDDEESTSIRDALLSTLATLSSHLELQASSPSWCVALLQATDRREREQILRKLLNTE